VTYFLPLACETSLPATDLIDFGTLGSWSSLPALDAPFLLVVAYSTYRPNPNGCALGLDDVDCYWK
jgi:hypothetical protein